jgi:hypothetical protein
VLTAVAAGRTRHSGIKDAIGADPTCTLDRLVEMRIIERLLPVTEQGTRSRRRVYRITDNYLAFYLGPLMRFRAEIERGLGKTIVSSLAAFLTLDTDELSYVVCARDAVEHPDTQTRAVTAADIFTA